eukprot:scaffold681_cov173-Ochromonas_danica.AAC.16
MKHDRLEATHFSGSRLDYDTLFQPQQPHSEENPLTGSNPILYAGGITLEWIHSNLSFINEEENRFIRGASVLKHNSDHFLVSAVVVEEVNVFSVNLSPNYPPKWNETSQSMSVSCLEAEIGLFDSVTQSFRERKWIRVTSGNLTAVTLTVTYTPSLPSSPEEEVGVGLEGDTSGLLETGSYTIRHRLIWTSDVFGRRALVLHNWESLKDKDVTDETDSPSNTSLRVLTFNMWHNNPLSWVYTNKRERWERYESRIKHFAEVIAQEDPDVVTLQEVRLDSTFFSEDGLELWKSFRKPDAGAQIEHFLHHLQQAQVRLGKTIVDFQVVYQPAMLLFEKSRMVYRNEEGVLILSKFPLRNIQSLFLSRELNNPRSSAASHFNHHCHFPLEVFTGDLNAEPHEESLELLTRPISLPCLDQNTCFMEDTPHSGNSFVDSWVAANPTLSPSEGYTFPACEPIKRIDYIFVRNHSCHSCKEQFNVRVSRSYLAGTRPTKDTEHLIGSREGLGMSDRDSPLWASDHFAVVTDLQLERV